MTDTLREARELAREIRDGLPGVTPGPWAYEPHGDTGQYGVGVLFGPEDGLSLFRGGFLQERSSSQIALKG